MRRATGSGNEAVDLREAVLEDAERVSSLVQRGFTPTMLPGWSTEAIARLHEENAPARLRSKLETAAAACIADYGGELAGFAMARRIEAIDLVVVDAAFRGRGVGTMLLARILEHLEPLVAQGTIQVNATEVSAPFYLRHGFVALQDWQERDGCRYVRMARATPSRP